MTTPMQPVFQEPELEGDKDILTIEQQEVAGLSQGAIIRRRFFRHKGAMISLAVLIVIVGFAYTSVGFDVFGLHVPGWYHHDYGAHYDILNAKGAPTWVLPFDFGEFPLGQSDIGEDIFAQVMRGTQQSLVVMVLFGLVAGVFGIAIGAISGFYGGWVDAVLMRITDVIIIIPGLVLFAVIGRSMGSLGAPLLAIALGLFGWTGLARLIRAEFLSLREREFVDAARVAGASDFRILFKHVLPNAVGVAIITVSLIMSGAILTEAALSFLGVGVQRPDVSLGQLLNAYESSFESRPWLFWWPGTFIIVIALCVNFIGDGLRDAFDPRQRRMPGKKGPWREAFDMIFRRGSGDRGAKTDAAASVHARAEESQ
ncbi:MAG: ABC transporter permease [Microbacterium sp.]